MSMRLQVVVDEAEMAEIRAAASRQGLTVSEWVRSVVRAARTAQSSADPARRLAVIAAGSEHAFPTGDIEQMLTEIEAGYAGDPAP